MVVIVAHPEYEGDPTSQIYLEHLDGGWYTDIGLIDSVKCNYDTAPLAWYLREVLSGSAPAGIYQRSLPVQLWRLLEDLEPDNVESPWRHTYFPVVMHNW